MPRLFLFPTNGNALAMYETSLQNLDDAIVQQQAGNISLTQSQIDAINTQEDVVQGRANELVAQRGAQTTASAQQISAQAEKLVTALQALPTSVKTKIGYDGVFNALLSAMMNGSDVQLAQAALDKARAGVQAALENPSLDTGTRAALEGLLEEIDSGLKTGDNENIEYRNNEINVDRDTISEIRAMERGERPEPSTYISQDKIDEHLAQFKGGVTKFAANAPSGTVGPPGGTFVMPKLVADDIIAKANGDVATLEKLLALDPGTLGNNPVRIDILQPKGLRMPSGNEWGANSKWIPGGYTMEGIIEATIDPATVGTYVSSYIS